MDVNAEFQHTAAMLDSPTLYPSPYVVMGLHGYTKHYYAGAERICAKIGEGFGAHFSESRPDLQETAFFYHPDLCGSRAQSQTRLSYAEMKQSVRSKHLASERADEVRSGISHITTTSVQHLQYLPFGERYIDQHPFGYQERFTFTGNAPRKGKRIPLNEIKYNEQRDEETGYGYFGARYMDHELMTMWLSVDPMADKYPSISPYAYCAWNPLKLIDPDGMEAIDNDDEWKVDKQNRTITRVGLDGGNNTQYVEGDGAWIRNETRGDLLNEYKDYTVIDNNTQGEAQLNPTVERENADAISAGSVAGAIAGGVSKGSSSMSKALFDKDNGTYMGKDGSTKQIKMGKNGGLNGRYKSQIKASAKYAKLGRVFTALGVASALVSAKNTESQYQHGQISNMRRLTNHAVDILGCTPVGWMAPFAYELGANYGPSTWLK